MNEYLFNGILSGFTGRPWSGLRRKESREAFKTYKNVIEYRPKEIVFVQTDVREFSVRIKPTDGITEIPLFWKFLCEDYQKEGVLIINVEPKIEEKTEVVTVYNEDDIKQDEVKISPKIIEK